MPTANRRQEALRDEIKGKPKQSWLRPDHKWKKGYGSRIYYYRYFDSAENMMEEVNVFELDPATFRLKHEVVAERARWNRRSTHGCSKTAGAPNFKAPIARPIPLFAAPCSPKTFPTSPSRRIISSRKSTQDKQMNFVQLDRYIADLAQSGFNTTKLAGAVLPQVLGAGVRHHHGLIAAPFGFMVGNRGAMAGIGVSIW